MKKLLIVSLFLLSLIGLFAQNPYTVVIDLQTEAGGYHPAGTVGIKVIEFYYDNEVLDGMFETLYGTRNTMYWNWGAEENSNASTTQYISPDDPYTPGRLLVQMQYMTNFGAGGGNVHCNFWFVDADGNEFGPVDIAKTGISQQTHPDVIAWGGPAAPTAPDAWATVVAPVDGSGDAAADVLLQWAYAGTVAVTGYEVTYQNVSAGTDAVSVDVTDATEYQLNDLMMDGYTYEWSAKPFVLDGETKVYPALETEMPVWSFTTASIPVIYPDNAINFFPEDNAMNVPLDVVLTWEYSAESPAVDGFEIYFNDAHLVDLGNNTFEFTPMELDYETTYTWKVIPFINDVAGAKTYLPTLGRSAVSRSANTRKTRDGHLTPEVTLEPLTFTTMAEPVPAPSLATLVGPATDVLAPINAQLVWAYGGTPVDGFEVIFAGADPVDVPADVMTYDPGMLMYNTEYTWSVKPYIDPAPAKGLKSRDAGRTYPDEDIVDWTFQTTDLFEVEEPVVIEGTPVTVQLEVVFTNPVPPTWTPNDPMPIEEPSEENPLPDNAGAFQFGATITQGVAGVFTYTFQIGDVDFDGVVYLDGVQYFAGTFTGGTVTVEILFTGAKEAHEVVVTEPTLPVELSSFTAVAHADEYVTLNWVTESESNLHGYNVYRAETENQDQAIRINPIVVEANNTTQTQNYTYTDNEVEATTYYYWLEVSELSNENSFHGPIVVTVEDDPVVPGITATTFTNFGPSPFTESTTTTLRVKEGETACVTIYNLLGQVVRRETFSAGQHDYTFNGRDLNNKRVANGIYFVRMTSPTASKSFKIVKIK